MHGPQPTHFSTANLEQFDWSRACRCLCFDRSLNPEFGYYLDYFCAAVFDILDIAYSLKENVRAEIIKKGSMFFMNGCVNADKSFSKFTYSPSGFIQFVSDSPTFTHR